MKRLITLTSASAIALVAVVAGSPAYAYPPGTHMRLYVSPRPVPIKPASLTLTATNVKPGCTVKFRASDQSVNGVADASGVATATLQLAGRAGQRRFLANTVSCSRPEHAATTAWVAGYQLAAPSTASVGVPFNVVARRYVPGKPITFTAVRNGQTFVILKTANSAGLAWARFTLPTTGLWVIVATQDGKAKTAVVQVS